MLHSSQKGEKKIAWLLFGFFFLIYFLTAQGTIQSSDGMSMYLITKNLSERGSFDIATDRYRSGLASKRAGGKYYSKYSPALPVFAVPFYLLGKYILTPLTGIEKDFSTRFSVSMSNAFIVTVICVLVFLIAVNKLGLKENTAICLSVIFGLATNAWSYSETFYSQPLSSVFLLCAAFCLLDRENKSLNLFLRASFWD